MRDIHDIHDIRAFRDIRDIRQARHIRVNEIILNGPIHTTAPKTMAYVLARMHQMRHLMSTRCLLSKGVKTTREKEKRKKTERNNKKRN